jgi:hypothetical protein
MVSRKETRANSILASLRERSKVGGRAPGQSGAFELIAVLFAVQPSDIPETSLWGSSHRYCKRISPDR